MASDFSCIGFPAESEEEYKELVRRAAQDGEPIKTGCGTYARWADANGAELWAHIDDAGQTLGAVPHFSGQARMRIGLTERIPRVEGPTLMGAFYGWADPDDEFFDSVTHPLVFDAPDFVLYQAVGLPATVDVQIAAFAQELRAYADIDAFFAGQQNDTTRLGPASFIPYGTFTEKGERPKAYAMFSGQVVACATFTNSITGQKFEWAQVRTLSGEVDVVADPSTVQGKVVQGGTIRGVFWLSGRLVDGV